jgi:hypothetical protein
MPWENITSMEEIIRFVMLAQTDRFTITELCEQFGISRKTGYKHLERYAANGLKGLQVRSHRPCEFPQRPPAFFLRGLRGLLLNPGFGDRGLKVGKRESGKLGRRT